MMTDNQLFRLRARLLAFDGLKLRVWEYAMDGAQLHVQVDFGMERFSMVAFHNCTAFRFPADPWQVGILAVRRAGEHLEISDGEVFKVLCDKAETFEGLDRPARHGATSWMMKDDELPSFFAAWFPDADLEGLTDEQVVENYLKVTPEEKWQKALAQCREMLAQPVLPLDVLVEYPWRQFSTQKEAREWLEMIERKLAEGER